MKAISNTITITGVDITGITVLEFLYISDIVYTASAGAVAAGLAQIGYDAMDSFTIPDIAFSMDVYPEQSDIRWSPTAIPIQMWAVAPATTWRSFGKWPAGIKETGIPVDPGRILYVATEVAAVAGDTMTVCFWR
jgi:hypothetical protein